VCPSISHNLPTQCTMCVLGHQHAWLTHAVCRLRGAFNSAFPASLGNCSSLRWLDLYSTRLQGTLPADIFSKWPQLQRFLLDGANLTGQLPYPYLGPGAALKTYVVRNTPLSTAAPGVKGTQFWVLDPTAVAVPLETLSISKFWLSSCAKL
jgi:hypothetical protein